MTADALREGANEVAKRLRDAGFEAYFAGGCVRDLVLGLKPKDYDVVTDAMPEQVRQVFRRTVEVGVAFGVVRVLLGKGREYEVATYRTEDEYTDGRRPDRVIYSKSKDEDVHRRDFTINALLMDPFTDEVIDLVKGRTDLERGVIRAVGDPERRFGEDRLRMLRAVRFAARFGFTIEPATLAAIKLHARELRAVSVERIVMELHAMWTSSRPSEAYALLRATGLLPPVFPFLAPLDPNAIDPIAIERLSRLPAAAKRRPVEELYTIAIAWASMLSLAPSADPEDVLGPEGYKLSRDLIRAVKELRREERLLGDPDSHAIADRVRLALRSYAPAALAYADVLHGEGSKASRAWEVTLADLQLNPLPTMPILSGEDLKRLGLRPGPAFKQILQELETEVFERRLRTKDEAIEWVKRRGQHD